MGEIEIIDTNAENIHNYGFYGKLLADRPISNRRFMNIMDKEAK